MSKEHIIAAHDLLVSHGKHEAARGLLNDVLRIAPEEAAGLRFIAERNRAA